MSRAFLLFVTMLFLACGLASRVIAANESLTLSEQCPPGFERKEDKCWLRTLYQQYDSLKDMGVGGLKTGLPNYRDGFTPQQIDLGRYLFFDPILSGDHSLACASCHQPHKGFADGKPFSDGIFNNKTTRSAPTLWNVGFLKSFFWDGSANSLEEQMVGPLYSEKEMGNTPIKLLNDLNHSPTYLKLFIEAFPAEKNSSTQLTSQDITLDKIYLALAAFQSSLVSLNSRYDQYAHGYHNALSEKEIEGLNVFRSFVARCAECHTPPLFTNQQIAVLGTPNETFDDIGAGKHAPSLKGGFKVPSLRNIVKTAPYMHNGVFPSLKETVSFYNKGRGHAIENDDDKQLHWHIWEPNLTEEELDRVVDFLATLTDETFMPVIPDKLPSGLPPLISNTLSHNQNKQGEHR